MGHPVEPFYYELPRGGGNPRAGAAGRGADVGGAGLLRDLRRPLPAGQLRSERIHGLHAAAGVRKRHAGFPAGAGRLRGADGPHRRLRVRADADGGAARVPRHSFCRRLGDADGHDDLALRCGGELFKPRYARQFALAHELGLHTWYHCCGEFLAIMEDFREIGVDVLNISQPNVNDMAEVGRRLRGRQCFMMPISYQTVSISGTPAGDLRRGAAPLRLTWRRRRRLHRLRRRIRRDGHVGGELLRLRRCVPAIARLYCPRSSVIEARSGHRCEHGRRAMQTDLACALGFDGPHPKRIEFDRGHYSRPAHASTASNLNKAADFTERRSVLYCRLRWDGICRTLGSSTPGCGGAAPPTLLTKGRNKCSSSHARRMKASSSATISS